MRVRFWGTRGSIARPGAATLRYGGNTSCVELRTEAGTVLVLDCGTGALMLGSTLVKEGVRRGHLLISHTHWDHIQGLPFFEPLSDPASEWDLYGPKGLSEGLREVLAGQMEHTYFPVTLEQFGARIRYHDLVEGAFMIGDVRVVARYLNHPALTLGYRFTADGATVVYSCDHEPYLPAAASGEAPLEGGDRRHVEFLSGADLVIHDAQYLAGEFPAKLGWGHSSAEYVVRACCEAGVRSVALTHHDPRRDDEAVDRLLVAMRERAAVIDKRLEVLGAAEGTSLEVRGGRETGDPVSGGFPAKALFDPSSAPRGLLLVMSDGPARDIIQQAALAEGLPPPRIVRRGEPLPLVSARTFGLILVEHQAPEIDGLALAREIRRLEGDAAVRVPIAIVAPEGQPPPGMADDAATDWLLAPFSVSYARTRIRSWMLRVACRWVRAREPADETQRLKSLQELHVLDTPPEERFDRLARLAAAAFGAPIALVSLVDRERQWFKARVGLEATETPREMAFCAHAVASGAELVVPDALRDQRFADNPLVTGDPRVRFYVGAPLVGRDGHTLGTLCVIDRRPRQPTPAQLGALRDLRDIVVAELEAGRSGEDGARG